MSCGHLLCRLAHSARLGIRFYRALEHVDSSVPCTFFMNEHREWARQGNGKALPRYRKRGMRAATQMRAA